MYLLEAKNLHKRFGNHVVLEEITLGFEAGKIVGIMGPNGAGKSTCFNVLTGLYAPDRGEILLRGERLNGLPAHRIAQKGISRSFQIMNIFDDFTVSENILIALPEIRRSGFNFWKKATSKLSSTGHVQDRVEEILQLVGLLDAKMEQARALSYGDRRALEIGIALAPQPQILFLDEPTQGLGQAATQKLTQTIKGLKNKLTMAIVEHDLPFLFSLADRIDVIHWGQVIASGTPEQLRTNKWVQRSGLMKGALNA